MNNKEFDKNMNNLYDYKENHIDTLPEGKE